MTKEEKQLLLKNICSRFLYGVICTDLRHGDSKITEVNIEDDLVYCFDFDEYVKIENCRLYLRPMLSMTKEEVIEYLSVCDKDYKDSLTTPRHSGVDWLNAHYFDYRGLIPMGLALEAKEGMYKNK